MSEPKPVASLTPCLLARKGGARPAMRTQLQPMQQFHEATARQLDDDLGWNDMGHAAAVAAQHSGEVVALNPSVAMPAADVPAIVRQQEAVAERIADVPASDVPRASARPRRSALNDGRRAAFTLRLDAERHLKLRLACTIADRSAQQLVTDAIDQIIAGLPDVATFAAQVRKNR